MAKKSRSGSKRSAQGAWEILRGGVMPKGFVDARVAEAKRRLQPGRGEVKGAGGQLARLWSDAQGPERPLPSDPTAAKARDALLALHGKLAKTKLAAPKLPLEVGGLQSGRITVKVTPPFDYAITIPTLIQGSPAVSATANKNGQMGVSAVTAQKLLNAGSAFSEVGIFFHPLGTGHLSVSANPSFSFQWWTNSLGTKPVRSAGGANLSIFGLEITEPVNFRVVQTAGTTFKNWDEQSTGEVHFDIRTDVPASPSAQIEVSRGLVYVVFVSAFAHVEGRGWPGSLAGAMMSVTVPSITWSFEPTLVFENA